ncbi:M20/M25/M40 family metallo-hydrolase [Spirillospora sp. NPDC049024]
MTTEVSDLTRGVRALVDDNMERLWQDLACLVEIPSYAANPEGVQNARHEVVRLFQQAGIAHVEEVAVSHDGRTATPLVYGEHPAPPVAGAPTVLLYAHYDVQPPGDGWDTRPFIATENEIAGVRRLYGRGTADDKSGICMHLAMLRMFGKDMPVNLKLVIEGEEETGTGILEDYLASETGRADHRFTADLIVMADTGNVQRGQPTITTSLRGLVAVDVTVSTLHSPVHSGVYGGPAPDAFMALVRMLAALQDDQGDVLLRLDKEDLGWPDVPDDRFRHDAGLLEDVQLIGTGPLAERLYGKPSVNVVGLDGVPPMAGATNALRPSVTAQISVRLAPHQNLKQAREGLTARLREVAPWGARVEVTPANEGAGFAADPNTPRMKDAHVALEQAYDGKSVAHAGQGGAIPLASAFRAANPHADILLWGCEEPTCAIHAPNESVSYSELQSMTEAEALLLKASGMHARKGDPR